MERWDKADDEEEEKDQDDDEDPTTKLLNARNKISGKENSSSKLKREMVTYKAIDSLPLAER